MTTPVNIVDGSGDKNRATVTSNGQLIVSPINYDLTEYRELGTPNTAYNFYQPKAGKQFVITALFLKADKQVSAITDADVVIYEASSEDTTTISRILFQTALAEDDNIIATPINILVNEGAYINGKTDDDDIHVTITGYYINRV